jgi:hypothetical protein
MIGLGEMCVVYHTLYTPQQIDEIDYTFVAKLSANGTNKTQMTVYLMTGENYPFRIF